MTIADIERAILESNGVLAIASRTLGISYETLRNRVERSKRLRRAVELARERILDETEAVLFGSALKGKPWAVKFLLGTQGRSRGYGEQVEVRTEGSLEIVIDWRAGAATTDGAGDGQD